MKRDQRDALRKLRRIQNDGRRKVNAVERLKRESALTIVEPIVVHTAPVPEVVIPETPLSKCLRYVARARKLFGP